MHTKYIKRIVFTVLGIVISLFSFQMRDVFARELESDSVVDGVFSTKNFNNLAEFSNLDVFAYDGESYGVALESGITLIPLQQYKVALTITDQDTIADLERVEIRFWYSGDSNTFETQHEVNTDGQSFVVTWLALTNEVSIVNKEAVLESDLTWALIDSKTPSLEALDEISFTFEIEFVISKVSPRSMLSEWHFGAIVEDGRMSVEEAEKINVITESFVSKLSIGQSLDDGFNMAFYGEVILPIEAQFMWEDVSAGTRFSDGATKTLANITFISNDAYASQIKSSEFWDAVLTQDIIDRLGLTPTDEIAIMLSLDVSTLVGVTFNDYNIAMEASILIYDSVYLPGLEGENLTGATLSALESLLNDDKQLFSIGFSDFEAADGLGYTNIVSTFTTFEAQADAIRQRSNEDGVVITLSLILALSDYFQNSRYEGVLTINITNITP
jgi:hypothetical protein